MATPKGDVGKRITDAGSEFRSREQHGLTWRWSDKSMTPDPSSEPRRTAWLDSPQEGEFIDRSVHVRGWAVPDAGRFSAEAWLGDRRLGFLDIVERPDVAEDHGPPASLQCGFETTFPTMIRDGGPQRLRVLVTSADGTRLELEREVKVAGPAHGSRTDRARGYRILRESPGDEGRGNGDPWPWFREHHDQAANEIIAFLEGSQLTLENSSVADVGCGDGIIDLGLMHHARPRVLVGFDLDPVSVDDLLEEARANGHPLQALPPGLVFRVCSQTSLPAPDASFDAVVSWSAFEHVRHPVRLMREIARVLRPDGFLFLQIWPLWWSQHGSHLWPWYPEGFAQLLNTDEEVLAGIAADPREPPEDIEFIAREYLQLNRIKVDELQRSLLTAGLAVAKFELLTATVHVPLELSRYPLSDLGIDGIKLVAVPA